MQACARSRSQYVTWRVRNAHVIEHHARSRSQYVISRESMVTYGVGKKRE